MSQRALRFVLFLVVLAGLAIATHAASSCFVYENSRNHSIPIKLSPTHKASLDLFAYEEPTESGPEMKCAATIVVPLSAYPSARLVARPADFASDAREVLDEWDISKCEVTVWIQNDTGDEMSLAEMCMTETFRYAGDSVWSASSESSCNDEFGA